MSLKDLLSRFNSRRSGQSIPHPANLREPRFEGIPDLVEPLLGWRVWRVWAPSLGTESPLAFSSVILDKLWAPRRRISAEHSFDLGARCRGLLDLDCSCGIYAFKTPLEAFTYLMQARDRLLGRSVDMAVGTVSLWGKVIECERGYKAQFAYPHQIYLPASVARFLGKVSSEFGVSTGIYASIKAEEISLSVPSDFGGRSGRKLRLKNSGSITAQNFPHEVGFYDPTPSPGQRNGSPTTCPDFSFPASLPPEEPRDARWL